MESRESGKLPLKFVGFAKFSRPPSELNSTANSENLPLRRSSKITLGTSGREDELLEKKKKMTEEGDPFMTRAKLGKSGDRWFGGGDEEGRRGGNGDGLRSIGESVLEEDLGWAEGLRGEVGRGHGYEGYGEGSSEIFAKDRKSDLPQDRKSDLPQDRRGLAHSNSVGRNGRQHQVSNGHPQPHMNHNF